MKKTRLTMTGLGLALVLAGCGSSGSTTGNGGSNGSGGDTGKGGNTGSGGNTGNGGSTGNGGNTGSGGSASGGNTGSGGSVSGSGGSTGSGGTTGSGGSASGGNTGSGGTTGSGGSASGGTTGSGGKGGTTGSGGSASGGTTGSGGSASGGTTGSGGVGGSGSGTVTVQLGQTEQTIEGFGINDNWAAGSTPAALFQTSGSGLGLTILRTGMSDTGAFYNTNEMTGDVATLKSGAGSDAKLIGSVWSPPASCKTANTINPGDTDGRDGGHLMVGASCATTWANTIASFAASNGFYAMSIGNEPDFNSCGSNDPCNGQYPTTLMTASEMVSWVKTAKTAFMSKAPNVKIIAPEASEWLHQWSNVSAGPDVNGHESSDPLKCGCFPDKNTNNCASTCTSGGGGYDYGHAMFADSAAWGDFDILGVHEYDSQAALAWPSDVNGGKPNKEVWETEMSGVKWWPQQGPSCDITNGVAVAGWIHSALTVGQASAWLWWWYQAGNTDDNEGLLLASGSKASTAGCPGGTDTKRHYVLGNYSKFIRPGYTRVDIGGTVPSGVQLSAYKGSDGTVVVVAINSSTSTVNLPIAISGGTSTPASMTPWVTDASNNLASKTAVTVSGGSFTASIGGPSVTTFVGK
ncbi:MAG TPA: glycoside hydrolase family 30 beta sandwich domain-containing protein [Polyangia bacterium]|nr:glycoside hydrolase family 30 beta sandwich domain-containing protein [Polyangia bacterium]